MFSVQQAVAGQAILRFPVPTRVPRGLPDCFGESSGRALALR